MNIAAMSWPGEERRLSIGRLHRLFAGIGFPTAIATAIAVLWSVQAVVGRLPDISAIDAARLFGAVLVNSARITLPVVPIIVIAVNRAPRAGIRRYLWLMLGSASCVVWCVLDAWLFYGVVIRPTDYLEAFIEATVNVAAYAYRSSARTDASVLTQRQIDGATLDAEVKRARLKLLRAQIEPHFLFNTLATVKALARIDRRTAVEMIDNLMRYLSEALPRLRQEESSLADELQLIDAYLRIHQIRLGTRLAYELSVPTELQPLQIPTMVLLTLVENAVKHGVNPAIDGGFIRVSATREPGSLVLKVADSGRGMTAQEGHGTGLANVRLRLMMLYGNDAVLSLARAESRGVVATVSIPMARAS